MNVFHENQVPWPAGRGPTTDRKSGPFQTNMTDACRRVEAAVEAFTRSGRPWRTNELWIYADSDLGDKGQFLTNQRGIRDPRVAVQFDLDGAQYIIATDRYHEPWQNLAGIAQYIKAIRAQERNGIFTPAEMFATFAALPSRGSASRWESVLGLEKGASLADAESAYRKLAKESHPDSGGSHEAMAELNLAIAVAREVLK